MVNFICAQRNLSNFSQLLLTFFGVAVLRQFELIPQAGLDAINSFISDDANFLTFFIVMLIVGSVLGLEKDILLKSFAGYVQAILGGGTIMDVVRAVKEYEFAD